MRIIPVLDLQRGRAVHARGGEREHYQPVRSVLHGGSDPSGLARAYRDDLGCGEIYVADLDAIAGGEPALLRYRELARLGLDVWLDAGVRTEVDAARLIGEGAAVVAIGLETLRHPRELEKIMSRCDAARIAFSLDLHRGEPLAAGRAVWAGKDALAIATTVLALGVRRLIVLDLARVGTGGGAGGLELISRLALYDCDLEIVAGGGVASVSDLMALKRSGARAALVASALHDGRLGRSDFERLV
jgi:phosphoribosylformimino-5-aminoimidazole carboxamide ribotide isomerase